MEPRAFDEAVLEGLEVGAKITDGACSGLTARRLRGATVLEWRGRINGQKCTLRLGKWPQLTIGRARTLAARAAAIAASGGDPRGRRRVPTTVAGTLDQYEREHLAHKRTGAKIARTLRQLLAPYLSWPLGGVGRADLKVVVEPYAARGEWASAHKARAILWAFMRWAEGEELIERAPGRMRLGAPEPKRAYVISLADCRGLFAGACALRTRERVFVRVLMLGGFRREEVASLRWDEVGEGRIVLGEGRTKQGREHVVPLTEGMVGELGRLPRVGGYVFGKPIGGFSHVKRRLERVSGVEGWRFHDFRRALSTHLSDAGVAPHVIERMLGHAVPGVAGVYNRAQMERQVKEALELWEGMITPRSQEQ